jgi:hypothetical protein
MWIGEKGLQSEWQESPWRQDAALENPLPAPPEALWLSPDHAG